MKMMADQTKIADQIKTAERAPKTIILKRSRIVVCYDDDYSTDDVIAAQKAAGKESAKFALYLAQRIATFDGKRLTMGEIRDAVRGRDFLQLTGELLGDGKEPEAGAQEQDAVRPN
jgi:hypothetical protein